MKIRYIILAALCLTLSGCGSKSPDLNPEDVLKSFHSTLAAGDFEGAEKLCKPSMHGYINDYKDALEKQRAMNKGAADIATEALSKAEVIISDIEKEKDLRMISYTIEDGYGNRKDKTAVMKEVEGEWKVKEIKDRQ